MTKVTQKQKPHLTASRIPSLSLTLVTVCWWVHPFQLIHVDNMGFPKFVIAEILTSYHLLF